MGSTPLTGISASKGDAVLGISKYKEPIEVWLEIQEQLHPGFCEENNKIKPERIDPWLEPLNPKYASLRWGLAFEDAICDLVGDVTNREKVYIHPEHDFISCHVDGEKNGRNQENKTAFDMAFKMGWGEPGSDMIPKGYGVQTQTQMMLSGQEWTDVNVLVFPKSPGEWEKMGYRVDMDGTITAPHISMSTFEFARNLHDLGYFHQYHVKADPELQAEILKQYLEFWNENVLKQIEPTIKDHNSIKWLFASPEGEIEATQEMTNLWDEKCSTENEIKSMQDRIFEIKRNFAQLIQIEYSKKNVKEGAEDNKLVIYAGSRKLASITRPKPSTKISAKMVDRLKDDNPKLYEEMKKTTFMDITEILLTEKQSEKVLEADKQLDGVLGKCTKDVQKILKSLKLTKILSKDSILKTIQKNKPELYKALYENSIVEETEGTSRLTMTKNEEE
jgi:predicted phage-related endonuclease